MFTVLDLFCGAGGLAEGFRQAGCRIVGGVDSDPDACATFAANFPEATNIVGDLRRPRIRERVLDLARNVEIVIGGPPCQAFSQVRNHDRLIDDPRNSLYREFVRIVRVSTPSAFLMENVPGLDQLGVRDQVLADLCLEGEYRVLSQVVDAVDFGVPQSRKRILFIGIRRSLSFDPPELSGTQASRRLFLIRRNGSRIRYAIKPRDEEARSLLERLRDPMDDGVVTVEQAIGDLAGLRAGTKNDELSYSDLPDPSSAYQLKARGRRRNALSNVSVPRINADTKIRLRGIPKGGNHGDLCYPLTKRYLTGNRWGPHNGTGRLTRRHYYAYRKLYPGFWSWTLNTKADSVYHYDRGRALTVREFARIQSFPDSFCFTTDDRRGELPGRIFGGAVHSRYRQAGNAVPPLLGKAIALSIVKTLTKVED